MVSKIDTVRGTYSELKEYCNSIIKPSTERDMNMQVGNKFYLQDKSFEQVLAGTTGFQMLPYLEVTDVNNDNEIMQCSMAFKVMWLFIASELSKDVISDVVRYNK